MCRHGDALVFAEVKTRTSIEHGRPYDAVDADKRRLIMQGADAWLRLLHQPDILYRFDIVEVIVGADGALNCSVVENAFTSVRESLY